MKNVSIMQVAGRIFNKPLLIHADSLNTVINIINAHAGLNIPIQGKMAALSASLTEHAGVQPQIGIAVIPVCGILSHKQDEFEEWLFGETSYETIGQQFRAALADPNITGIVFDIDSPGGEVSGCFDLVDEIYSARGIKSISAIINETAFSGAYAIASAAEKIFIPRTGGVGSVGVIYVHLDQSKYDENIGVKYTPIYAGSHKADFDRHSPLSTEAQKAAQDETTRLYDLFVKTVARNRGISPQAVRDTEAALYFGKNAVDAGLADSVMSWSKALNDVATKKTNKGGNMKALIEKMQAAIGDAPKELLAAAMAELGFVPKAQTEGIVSLPAVNLAAIAAGLGVKTEQLTGDLKGVDFTAIRAGAKDEAKKEVSAYAKSIFEICTLGGMEKMAVKFISDGVSVEDARKQVMEAMATGAIRLAIHSTVGSLSTGEVNPLIQDAREKAEAYAKK